jgi:integrase
MTSITYTEPKLVHHNHDLSKIWFVWFDITNKITGEKIRKQFKSGINRNKKLKDRLAEGYGLVAVLKEQLKAGWNPFDKAPEINKAQEPISEVDRLLSMNFIQALDFALSECKVASHTFKGYRLCVDYIKTAAKAIGIDSTPAAQIEQTHIKLLLKKCSEMRKWTNKSYNKNVGYLCAVLGRLIEWDVIKHNPAEKIKTLPTTETEKFIPYTEDEKSRIREYFYLHHYNFYVIVMMIYHCGLRPKEILSLKIKDIDLTGRTIKIYPEIELENSKTKSVRKIPINNHLLPFLRELQLHKFNPDYYAFGSPYEKGMGNRGSSAGRKTGAMHPDYFKPSEVMIKRDTITKFWKKIVIDKLRINKYLYAAKHTGGREKILAGMDLDALKTLYGHSSKYMTEKYARVIKDIYREQIINHSPEF